MQMDFSPDRNLFPFEARWFDGAGPRVHYVDEGKGTPVVMFHGNPTWSFLYRKVIKELKDEFRCIAMDYPGFGMSERPANYGYTSAEHAQVVGKLVDHLGLEGFIVVGQDWGGPIGMTVALERGCRGVGRASCRGRTCAGLRMRAIPIRKARQNPQQPRSCQSTLATGTGNTGEQFPPRFAAGYP